MIRGVEEKRSIKIGSIEEARAGRVQASSSLSQIHLGEVIPNKEIFNVSQSLQERRQQAVGHVLTPNTAQLTGNARRVLTHHSLGAASRPLANPRANRCRNLVR